MKKLILYLWQLPQLIVGLLLYFWYRKDVSNESEYGNNVVFGVDDFPGGISLGPIVLVEAGCDPKTIQHELGHCKQSLYLGWLYLIVIGIPSLIWAIVCDDMKKYYTFYTESWADKLGGVER